MERVQITDGALTSIKWCALLLMVGDHVNAAFFDRSLPYLTEFGRLVMPMFAFVLAFNLARPQTMERGVYQRTLKRLALFAFIAAPFHYFAFSRGLLPLNIMVTFSVVVLCMWLIDLRRRWANALTIVLLLGFGPFVEYWLPGIALTLAFWWWCKTQGRGSIVAVVLALLSMWLPNGSGWALLVLPVLWALSRVDIALPRLRWAFYVFYPAHLAVIVLIKAL